MVQSSWRHLPTTRDIYERNVRYKGIAGEIVKYGSTCPYRKSNPDVLMVQTSEMWAKRSMLLKAIRFGALRRSTLSWCRRTRISASNRALDRNSLVSAQTSNLKK